MVSAGCRLALLQRRLVPPLLSCLAIIQRMQRRGEERWKSVVQVVAIVGLLGLFSVIFHKATVDVSVMWRQHSGTDFWVALGRYLFGNLAG